LKAGLLLATEEEDMVVKKEISYQKMRTRLEVSLGNQTA